MAALLFVRYFAWGFVGDHIATYRQNQYLKNHGVVATTLAHVPGPIVGLTTDAAGNVYALSNTVRAVFVIHPDGTQRTIKIPPVRWYGHTYSGALNEINATHAMVTVHDGTTFVADEFRESIIRIAPNGAVNMNWVHVPTAPFAMGYRNTLYGDDRGNLYEFSPGWVSHISPDGKVTVKWSPFESAQVKDFSADLTNVAVGTNRKVYIYGLGKVDGIGVSGIYQMIPGKGPTLVSRYWTTSPYSQPGPPPKSSVTTGPYAFSTDGALWSLGYGALGSLGPNTRVTTWWVTTPEREYADANLPFAIGSNRVAYTVRFKNPADLEKSWNTGKPITVDIVKFTLPKSPQPVLN